MKYEKYIRGSLKKTDKNGGLIMYIGLYNGYFNKVFRKYKAGQAMLKKEEFFNGSLESYEGPLMIEDIFKAIDMGCRIQLVGIFYYKKERTPILEYALNHKMRVVAKLDSTPYRYCFPDENSSPSIIEDYEMVKRKLDLPLMSEGFDNIEIYNLDASSFGDEFTLENYTLNILNKYDENNILPLLPLIYGMLAAKYAKLCDSSVLDIVMCYLAFAGMDADSENFDVQGIDEDDYDKISALNFYAYAHTYIDRFYEIGYSNRDIYETIVALSLYRKHDMVYFDNHREKYNDTNILKKIILLQTSRAYIDIVIKNYIDLINSKEKLINLSNDLILCINNMIEDEMCAKMGEI